jgi:hypothetical protein
MKIKKIKKVLKSKTKISVKFKKSWVDLTREWTILENNGLSTNLHDYLNVQGFIFW